MRSLPIDPATAKVERIDLGGSPHWIAVGHATHQLFASFKTKDAVGGGRHPNAQDDRARSRSCMAPKASRFRRTGKHSLSVHTGKAWCMCSTRRSHALRKTVAIEGAPARPTSCDACAFRPTGDTFARHRTSTALPRSTSAATLKQIGGFATPKAPMGFGFAADGKHAFLCCHDAAVTLEFDTDVRHVSRGSSRQRQVASSSSRIHEDISCGAGGAIGRRLTPLLGAGTRSSA